MGALAVVRLHAPTRDALRRGARGRGFRVVSCRSLEHVARLIRTQLVDGVVVDVRSLPLEPVTGLVRHFPTIPFFALAAFRPDDGGLLGACRRVGFRTILVEGVDEVSLGELIAYRSASGARRAALDDAPRLLRLTEPMQRRAWMEVLGRVGVPTTTADIARTLGRTREHLSREFAAGGAPNLKRVIDLARVACAAQLLANPGYDVSTVATILGFASSSHLGGGARRIAGVTPRELGALGPRGVLGRFVRGRMRSRM